jgi:hypothetical protein
MCPEDIYEEETIASEVRRRGQVRHSYTISALAIHGKLRFTKCRYGSTDCLARDVKSGGNMGYGKNG